MGEVVQLPLARLAGSRPGGPNRDRRDRPEAMPEQRRLWWRIWSAAPGIGWLRLQRLEDAFGDLEQAWQADAAALQVALARPTKLGERGLERLLAYRATLGSDPIGAGGRAEARRRWRDPHVLVCGDAALPASLKELERPPLELHWQGQGSLWAALRQRKAVAVVGTRRPSRQGEAIARRIGHTLAEAGWPVVSGLAEGVDAAAHHGCLEAGGRPVGVLGTPLERVYPRHHEALQAQVAQRGLLVSELPAGTPVRAGHFAARNRLQVALSCAVVLVECPHGSGALHSARLAWQEGTPLWVVPADVSRSSAAGSNRWLAQGATALLDPQDLIDSLGQGPLHRPSTIKPSPPRLAQQAGTISLSEREAALLGALGTGASLEQLCRSLRQEPGRLCERLLQLELAGLVCAEPGLWWRPC